MPEVKDKAKKALKQVVKAKTKVIKWKIYLYLALALLVITIPIVLVVTFVLLFGGGDTNTNGYSVNGKCSVSGGNLDNKGKGLFEKNAKGGALEGKTDELVKIAKKHNIPPNLFLAIIAHESNWGKSPGAKEQNNPLSVMGNGNISNSGFPTIEKGLEVGAENLEKEYIDKGLTTPEKIGPKYAPTVNATNDASGSNNNWIPTIKSIMKSLGGSKVSSGGCSTNSGGKSMKFDGKLPSWSNDNPGKNNLYTPGQCTWYAYGIRQKMGKPISTFWGDAHLWNDRAKQEGYKVDTKAEPGALFIAEQGAGGHDTVHGHVGVVTGVKDGGKTFEITEMNYNGPYKVNERTVKMTNGYSFIHDKK